MSGNSHIPEWGPPLVGWAQLVAFEIIVERDAYRQIAERDMG